MDISIIIYFAYVFVVVFSFVGRLVGWLVGWFAGSLYLCSSLRTRSFFCPDSRHLEKSYENGYGINCFRDTYQIVNSFPMTNPTLFFFLYIPVLS